MNYPAQNLLSRTIAKESIVAIVQDEVKFLGHAHKLLKFPENHLRKCTKAWTIRTVELTNFNDLINIKVCIPIHVLFLFEVCAAGEVGIDIGCWRWGANSFRREFIVWLRFYRLSRRILALCTWVYWKTKSYC